MGNNRVIRVNDDAYEAVANYATERGGISLNEAANELVTRKVDAVPAAGPLVLPSELEKRLADYAKAKGLLQGAALVRMVEVGLNRTAALDKDIAKRKANAPPKEPRPVKDTAEKDAAREAKRVEREAKKAEAEEAKRVKEEEKEAKRREEEAAKEAEKRLRQGRKEEKEKEAKRVKEAKAAERAEKKAAKEKLRKAVKGE